MALESKPNDPYRTIPTNDELIRQRAERLENEMKDNELQFDPELAEGPASGGRIALFAIAIVAILGVVFYGLNNGSMNPNDKTAEQMPPAATSQQTPAQTTGSAAPTAPAANPAPAPAAPAKK
jgi:hypothetical protein